MPGREGALGRGRVLVPDQAAGPWQVDWADKVHLEGNLVGPDAGGRSDWADKVHLEGRFVGPDAAVAHADPVLGARRQDPGARPPAGPGTTGVSDGTGPSAQPPKPAAAP